MNLFLVLICILVQFRYSESILCDDNPKNAEAKLKQALLCSYDKDSRPVTDHANATTVNFRLYIKEITFADADNELTVRSWASMKWKDVHLKWNPEEYNGIDGITIHSDEIWMPDLSLYNSENTQFSESCAATHCFVQSSGTVSCLPPCSHTAKCKTNYSNWPYDIEKCVLHFGTWMNKGEEVNFKEDRSIIDSNMLDNNEWKVIQIQVKNSLGNYSCCPNETFPSVIYRFEIQRHSASDMLIVFTPAVVLAVVNLIVLWLSPNSMERLTLTAVSILAHFLYMQYLSWLVPKNGSSPPSVLIYFRDSLIITATVLIESLVMRGLLSCHSDTPGWLQSLTQSVRGNKIGQLMFTNPYILNSDKTSAETETETQTADDSANLIEGQLENPDAEVKSESKSRLWFNAVKFIDTLLFLILVIIYATMIFGWLPSSKLEKAKLDLIVEKSDE